MNPHLLSAVVMTHPRRLPLANQLVDKWSAENLGIILDPDPGGRPTAVRTGVQAWSSVPDSSTHHLVLQDDAVLAPYFWEYARGSVSTFPDTALAFYTNWNSRNGGAVRLGALTGAEWVAAAQEYTPCVALALPADIARGFARFAALEGNGWPLDVMMKNYLDSAGVPVYLAVPNPVDHRESPSLASNDKHGARHSACFSLLAPRRRVESTRTFAEPNAIPFFKYGSPQVAVRVRTQRGELWEDIACERYLGRIGVDITDLRREFAAALRSGEPTAGIDGDITWGTWLTACAMGIVAHQMADGILTADGTLPDGEGTVDRSLGSIGPSGVCERLSSAKLKDVAPGLKRLAWCGLRTGLERQSTSRRTSTRPKNTRIAHQLDPISSSLPVLVVKARSAVAFAVPLVKELADAGYRITVFSPEPIDFGHPRITWNELTDSGDALDPVPGVEAILELGVVAGRIDVCVSRAGEREPHVTPARYTLRVPEVYGPHVLSANVLKSFIVHAMKRESLEVEATGDENVEFVHVSDVAGSLLQILTEQPAVRVLALRAKKPMSLRQLSELVCRTVREISIRFRTSADLPQAVKGACAPADSVSDDHVLRIEPKIALRQGIRSYAQWLAYSPEASQREPIRR
jgi:hypothetical protein